MNKCTPEPERAWLWDSPQLREALAARKWGRVLELLQDATGMGSLDFATVLDWDYAKLNRAKNGKSQVLFDVRELVAMADNLDMPRWVLIPVLLGELHETDGVSGVDLTRRQAGGLGLGVAAGLAAGLGLGATEVPAKVDAAHVTYFQAGLDELIVDDHQWGAGGLVQTGARLYDRARRMLAKSDYTEDVAYDFVTVTGQIANHLGWLHTDMGDNEGALRFYTVGLNLGEQVGNDSLVVTSLQSQAQRYTHLARTGRGQGYARQALLLSQRASELARREPHPALHALLASRAAAACSALGDASGFASAMTAARRELDREPRQETPLWLRFVNPSELAMTEALGRWDLGEPMAAAEVSASGLDANLSPRNAASYRAIHATALAAAGDLPTALSEGLKVLPALGTGRGKINSPRIISRLRTVRDAAEGQRGNAPEFREMFDRVITTMAASTIAV
jgi:hypothetical protein